MSDDYSKGQFDNYRGITDLNQVNNPVYQSGQKSGLNTNPTGYFGPSTNSSSGSNMGDIDIASAMGAALGLYVFGLIIYTIYNVIVFIITKLQQPLSLWVVYTSFICPLIYLYHISMVRLDCLRDKTIINQDFIFKIVSLIKNIVYYLAIKLSLLLSILSSLVYIWVIFYLLIRIDGGSFIRFLFICHLIGIIAFIYKNRYLLKSFIENAPVYIISILIVSVIIGAVYLILWVIFSQDTANLITGLIMALIVLLITGCSLFVSWSGWSYVLSSSIEVIGSFAYKLHVYIHPQIGGDLDETLS
jgi:hypothetical protein